MFPSLCERYQQKCSSYKILEEIAAKFLLCSLMYFQTLHFPSFFSLVAEGLSRPLLQVTQSRRRHADSRSRFPPKRAPARLHSSPAPTAEASRAACPQRCGSQPLLSRDLWRCRRFRPRAAMAASGGEEERAGGAALGAGQCHPGVARRRGRTLLVRHLPAELTAAEKEDLLQHFGAVAVRVLSDHGRLVRARAGGGPGRLLPGSVWPGGHRPCPCFGRSGAARGTRWGGQRSAPQLCLLES